MSAPDIEKVVHELNNLLGVIMSYGSSVRSTLPPDDSRHVELGEVLRAVERAAGLTRQLVPHTPPRLVAVDPPSWQQPRAQSDRRATVLVVEDEPALRRVAHRALNVAGHTVDVAADGEEAIRKIDALGGSLDVLVSDVVMPGLGGYEVAAHAARVAPHAAVLLTSGYLDEKARREACPDLPILWKPVAPSELVRAVAVALASRRGKSTTALAPGEGPRVVPAPAPGRAAAIGRGARVLVVEDDAAMAEASGRILGADGCEVVLGASLGAARAALESGAFDAMVVDIGLPDGSGFDLLRELRGRNSELPVVMITGAPSAESAAQALRSRVSEYLPKPFAADELVRVVRAAVESGRIARLRTKLLAARFGGDELVGDIRATEERFARALSKIRMVYQPLVRAADGSVFGYEALLRSDEPGMSPPPRLLAAAELLGRVEDVGRAVRAAVAATLLEHPHRRETVFVNVHPLELRADLLDDAADALLPWADRVVLEVTERASFQCGSGLDGELERIRRLGYRLAVDDLGEGYAGLSSLVRLRPDFAKIDMSLIRDVHKAPLKRDIVAAVVHMARHANITVVAEGIETTAERDALAALECDLMQGYLFARPGPPFPSVGKVSARGDQSPVD